MTRPLGWWVAFVLVLAPGARLSAQSASSDTGASATPSSTTSSESASSESASSQSASTDGASAEAPAPATTSVAIAEPVPSEPDGSRAAAPREEQCDDAPVFDPSTPRFEIQVGGGYSALFHTWRQTSDNFMNPGRHADGLYHGPLIRGELAFALGGLSLSAIYTHLFLTHDGTNDAVQMGLLSGEIGVQCACRGSTYVWSFGVEGGADLLNGPSTTVFLSIEHRSMFYVWEGLFVGFDVDFATFIGLTSQGASGGGILGSVFLGYSLG